jgi:hypothetical protein
LADELRVVRPARQPHAARDHALQSARPANRLPQRTQFGDEFRQHILESSPRCLVRGFDSVLIALGTDHEVDRPMLKMPSATGKKRALGLHAMDR